MSNFLLLSGQQYNLLARGVVALNPAADGLYAVGRLSDGRPIQDFRFGSAAADATVTVDGRLVPNPGLETWSGGVPLGWSKTGTVVETTVAGEFRSGSAAKVSSGGVLFRDIVVRAGEKLQADIWGRITAASSAVGALRVLNRDTGKYLTAGGAWSATPQDAASTTSTTYVNLTKAVPMESFNLCGGRDLVNLRFQLVNSGAGDFAFFDDVTMYPGVDFLSIHGHNIDPGMTVELRSSTDNFSANDVLQATVTKDSPAFYAWISSGVLYLPYWRVKFVGTPLAALKLGEVAIAQAFAASRTPDMGYEITEIEADVANETEVGEVSVLSRADSGRRAVALSFDFRSHPQYQEARDEVFRRSRGRKFPMVLVPDSDRPEVFHGRIDNRYKVRRTFLGIYTDNDLVLAESPFPIAAA